MFFHGYNLLLKSYFEKKIFATVYDSVLVAVVCNAGNRTMKTAPSGGQARIKRIREVIKKPICRGEQMGLLVD